MESDTLGLTLRILELLSYFIHKRCLPSGRSKLKPLYNWEKTFYTESKSEVEAVLAGLGYSVEWRDQDMLHYWYSMTSVRKHPISGEMVWSNQVYQYSRWPLLSEFIPFILRPVLAMGVTTLIYQMQANSVTIIRFVQQFVFQ